MTMWLSSEIVSQDVLTLVYDSIRTGVLIGIVLALLVRATWFLWRRRN